MFSLIKDLKESKLYLIGKHEIIIDNCLALLDFDQNMIETTDYIIKGMELTVKKYQNNSIMIVGMIDEIIIKH